jgi:hypothetical protein
MDTAVANAEQIDRDLVDAPSPAPAALERRRHPRQPRADSDWVQMRLRTGDVLSIVDIGTGGALVETRRRLLPGVTLLVHLSSSDRALSVKARVTRCAVCALDAAGGVRYRGALEFVREPEL